MAYDVTSLVQDIKTLAKDSSLLDSLVTNWLQETQDRVLGRTRYTFQEAVENQTLVIGDLTFGYFTNLQTILSVTLRDGTNVTRPGYLPYAEFDDMYPRPAALTPGCPGYFTDYGDQLYWNTPLDKAYILTMRYLRTPVRLSSGAIVPDIPEEYKQILIHGALAGVEEYRENFDIAAIHLRKAEDLAEDMLQRYGMRQLVTPHKVTTTRTRGGAI